MLVRDAGRVLLARKPEWAPGRYALVAGFVDNGESLEGAVAREVKEEVGVDVTDIQYVGSQNWPFPSQLMVGFVARYAGGDLAVDRERAGGRALVPRRRASRSALAPQHRALHPGQPRSALAPTPKRRAQHVHHPSERGPAHRRRRRPRRHRVSRRPGRADATAGVKGQTEQILKKFDELLAAAGSSKAKLLSATVWLANMGSYDEMNAAWDAWVHPDGKPARATVEARLANPKYLVEIAGIAAR